MPYAIPLIAAVGAQYVGAAYFGVAFGTVGSALIGAGAGALASNIVARPPSLADLSNIGSSVGAGRTHQVRQPIKEHQYIYGRVKTSGPLVFIHTKPDEDGREDGYLYLVIVLAAHHCHAIGEISIGEDVNTAERFQRVNASGATVRTERFTKHLGTADQAADAEFVNEIGDAEVWGADHRLRGRAYLAIRLTHDAASFPSGLPPNIGAIVDGFDSIYDPRAMATGWSDNSALCTAHWLTSSFGLALSWAELDEASVIAAANVCDELVGRAAGGTVKRYTCNGTFTADMAKRDVLQQMLSSMAGVIVHMGGKWTMYAGAPATPTVTLDEDDLRGALVNMPKRSMRDRFNGVRAVYVNPDASWQPVDAPPLLNPAYVAEDRGEELYKDLRFPFTTDTATVQRLMKIDLERNRRQRVVQFPAKLTALRIAPWDGVYLDLERYAFAQEQFRVVGWALAEDGGIDLALQADDAAVYAWSASEEETPATPQGVTGPNSVTIAAPATLTVSTPVTSTYSAINVVWAAVSSIWLAGYDTEFRAAGDSVWTNHGQVTIPSTSVARVAATDFRVRSRTSSGVTSDWLTSAAPAMPTGVSATPGAGQIDLAWTNGSGAAQVQIFVNTTDELATATLLDTVSGASYTHSGLGAGQTRYYWLRSIAADGNFSNETASVNATTT